MINAFVQCDMCAGFNPLASPLCRDLTVMYDSPPPGICVKPEGDDISRVCVCVCVCVFFFVCLSLTGA